MSEIIVIQKEQLEQLIENAVGKAFRQLDLTKEKEKENEVEILNISQASKFTGLAKQTIYEKTSHKSIPHHKKCKKLYFLRSELEKWIIEGNRVKTNEELETEAINYSLFKKKPF